MIVHGSSEHQHKHKEEVEEVRDEAIGKLLGDVTLFWFSSS